MQALAGTRCPNCERPAILLKRTGYVGEGAEMVAYPIQVLSCGSCRHEWVDKALSRINASHIERAHGILAEGEDPPRRRSVAS